MNLPIFILASERSGTNLLRTLIGQHKDICAPVAPHFFDTYYKHLRFYGNLGDSKVTKELLRDALDLANHPFNAWDIRLDIDEILSKNKPSNLVEIIDILYREKSKQEGKNHYCSKGIHNFHYVGLIRSYLPNAKFIYLSRDVRDHTVSWLKTPLFMHTVHQIAMKWNTEQTECLNVLNNYHGVHFLRYEDLISNSEKEMASLLQFLEVEIDENCFQTNQENKESKRNEFWKNLSKPIIADNKRKYKSKLSNKELNIIETICGENMDFLGYSQFDTNRDWKPANRYLFKIEEFIKTRNSKNKNKDFFQKKMKDLQDKISLIKNQIQTQKR